MEMELVRMICESIDGIADAVKMGFRLIDGSLIAMVFVIIINGCMR